MKWPIAFITVLILSSMPLAQELKKPEESMRGLSGVHLKVLSVDAEIEKAGLTQEKILKLCSDKLKAARIKNHIIPAEEDGDANLIIFVDTLKNPQGIIVFKVQISLVQAVKLKRLKKDVEFASQTYGVTAHGLTNLKRLDVIETAVEEKLAEFIKTYQSVNPK